MVEKPSSGEMLASILFTSEDGKSLLEGAAPSLPPEYNAAIHGIPVGQGVGSCGTAAFLGVPVIVTDIATDPLWKDFKELAMKHDLRACWSMPIRAADGRVLGTFANYYREPKEPTERDLEVIGMVTRTTAIAIERHRNELARQRAEEQRLLLLRELDHRIKNVFALVSSILSMSARTATDPRELARSVQGRIDALSKAHELVRPGWSGSTMVKQSSVPLSQVIGDILAPHLQGGENWIAISGQQDVMLASEAVAGIALVLHELATNAVKYGALSQQGGKLTINWSMSEQLLLRWTESGVQGLTLPDRTGFGSKLTRGTIEGQFGGNIAYDWKAEGLEAAITIPADRLANGS